MTAPRARHNRRQAWEIREWARRRGIPLVPMGRIPKVVVAAFYADPAQANHPAFTTPNRRPGGEGR